MCVCACMHMCVCVCACMCVFVCMHACVCVCVCVYACIRACMCACMCVYSGKGRYGHTVKETTGCKVPPQHNQGNNPTEENHAAHALTSPVLVAAQFGQLVLFLLHVLQTAPHLLRSETHCHFIIIIHCHSPSSHDIQ